MGKPSSFQVYNASAGSGKTFTLVKEYLKIILDNNNFGLFQNILAITFTNKAAGEMKDRVLEYLLLFSIMDEETREDDMLLQLVKETHLNVSLLQNRSKERFQQILKNYSSFHIKTIDSFTNKLIKSFAFDLGLTMDFEVELDTDSILKESVDAVIARIGVDKELTEVLVAFAKQKTLDDKSWDISRELLEISKLLLNENHLIEIEKSSRKSLSEFITLEKKLRKEKKEQEEDLIELGQKGLDLIDGKSIEHKDFYRSQFPKFFIKLIDNPKSLDFEKESSLYRNIEAHIFYSKSKSDQVKNAIEEIVNELIAFYSEAEKVYERFKLNDIILKNLIPMAVMNSIHQAMEEIKNSNNIRLNAEFNQMISDHLKNEPAPFIYEKLGEKFKHFFIDEMQDTSVLQWQNLIPLVDNALSAEDSSLLLVGDAKQAIYRWRGGRAEQFINLSSDRVNTDSNPFQASKLSRQLESNYRSYSEIITFNNEFFSHISKNFENESYRDLYKIGSQQKTNSKNGGYVKLQFVDDINSAEIKEEVFPKKVYETINELLEQYDSNEICILVRKKREGVEIAKYLTEKGVEIVSSETLLIKNNNKICFVIDLLNFLAQHKNDEAKFGVLNFLYHHLDITLEKHHFMEKMMEFEPYDLFEELKKYHLEYNMNRFNEYSIFEGVEDIIRSFKLTDGSDAFIQFFLDFVFDFTQRKSQKRINFLEYWEERKEKLNIVNSDDVKAVRIMTIHKSKGLEFPVVIYPYDLSIYFEKSPKAWYTDLDKEYFNGFESVLVDASSSIQGTGIHGKQIYSERRKEKELDSFNLLYVCLTRAVEQLYVITEKKIPKKELTWSSHLLHDFLVNKGLFDAQRNSYEFGNERRVSVRKKRESVTELQKEFISNSWADHQINIVASSSVLWDEDRVSAINYGNLIHEMMSGIFNVNDIEIVLNKFVNKGLILKNELKETSKKINEIVSHPGISSYFAVGNTVFTEREILTETGQILIPDRLIFQDKDVVIIDYKTGKSNKNHQLQIENYALALRKLNFTVKEKILVYIDEEITLIKS